MWFTKSSNRFDFEHYHEPAVENLPGIPLNFSHFDQSRALWRARSPLPEPSVASGYLLTGSQFSRRHLT